MNNWQLQIGCPTINGQLNSIRFPSLHLWRNPFGELTRQERSVLAVCDLSEALQWLAQAPSPGERIVEFIAPCGHGKSTHLHALANSSQFANAVYVYVPPTGPYASFPDGVPLLVDEADRLPWLMRRKLFANRQVHAIAVHRSLQRGFARRGRCVLTIDVAIHGCADRLLAILNQRIIASESKPGLSPRLNLSHVNELIRRYGDDIRAMEDYLYEHFQQLTGDANDEMRFDH